MAAIDDYRNKIDEIDKEITRLFEERMDIVIKVGEYKKQNNLPIFDKNRESQVIKKNLGYLKNKEYEDEAREFYTKIMEIAKSIEHKKSTKIVIEGKSVKLKEFINKDRIGYYGVRGSFTEEAMIKYFGDTKEAKAYEEFEKVFEAVKNEEIDYGIVPIENSSTGAISDVYDLLYQYEFYIVGEVCIKINQNLVGIKGTTLESITEIYSHPQGFGQSTDFLKTHSDWKLIPFQSTASSARLINDLNDNSKAAIASKRVASIYDLEVIKENINNQSKNFTRFVVISKENEKNPNADKVSVVFSLDDKAGTLYKLLRHFAENNINMIKIESRPMKNGPWKYFLYVDFEGEPYSDQVTKALSLIKQNSLYFRLLGAYEKNIK
ncbi:prephenate dehydratase [Clostridium beijerinckii]|uniref:Bifunctional chorismate mutase/prephenate dehydratase n=2 Tax=Clostridium beijerinckii TaxID=1520 RepID=A0A0B5QUG2_CLOBE|nr:prephenate dehydratase [Clostridium beijerinckii]AJH01638.1 bifunctional chorismate mutase/prephenate dehydratase [Clostridium beijerinckii]AQS07444.1 P-protein [Clostridium beijerinckii]MBA2884493.1 chorismate mutase/prephenate dehydratase [Clostridium beijerinckii]MBA2898137.1 chorismate mutase/prephenate dehydratase [Clostridium beijerinckii]MBA2909988.1 chorismate mutase/prephenate dehydratase [Clostridium beijerinckii]